MKQRRQRVTITVNNKAWGTKLVSEEFAELIANYNFKDEKEVNFVLHGASICWRKNPYDWCPAQTKFLKEYLSRRV